MIQKIKFLLSNPVARNSAIMFIGTMATNFGAYLYQVVVVRIMGPEQYSEFAALLSLLFILSVPAAVVQLVLTKYFSLYKASDNIGESRTLFVKSMLFIGIISVIGLGIYIPTIPWLEKALHIYSYSSFVYLYFIVVGTFIITICTGLLNGYQKFLASSVNSTLLMITRLVSGITMAPLGVASAVLGNTVSNTITLVCYFFSVRFVFRKPSQKITIKKADVMKFAVPSFLSALGMTALFNMDVVLVKHFFDANQAGIYASLTIFGKIIFFAASPISLVIFPMIIEKKQLKRNYDSLFFLGLIGVVVLSIVIVLSYIISGPFVIKLLFGSKFSAAGPYLGIYGIFMAFVTVANYLMTVCLAINKVQSGTIVLIGAICESLAILFFHNSLLQVMISISIVSGILMSILLIYYRYGPLNKSGSE